MNKIQTIQWIGTIPFLLLILLLTILWCFTGFNKEIFYILALVFVTAMYFFIDLFFYDLFEIGEKKLPGDKEILMLKKEEYSLWWMYISGAGFTFLIGGIPFFKTNPILAIAGIIFLSVGNLVYNILYYPIYRLLYRKRLVEISLSQKNLKD
jgi:hypothetical protein